MNPILIYLATRMIPLQHSSGFTFNGMIQKFFDPALHAWLGALAYILTWWIVHLKLSLK